MSNLSSYYEFIKPGIVYGNVLTVVAGCLFGAQNGIDATTLVAVTVGSGLVVASACAANNVFDRRTDRRMKRTSMRPSATGAIGPRVGMAVSVLLLTIGFLVLSVLTNALTVFVGLMGWVGYVLVYTPLKHRSVHATAVGSFPGAMPILAGYTAATGTVDGAAVALVAAMATWQVPHFYAIAMFRGADYQNADTPTFPSRYGSAIARMHITFFAAAFALSAALLAFFVSNFVMALVMVVGAAWWLWGCLRIDASDEVWAKKTFIRSLTALMVLCLSLGGDGVVRVVLGTN